SCRSCGPLFYSKWAKEVGEVFYQVPAKVQEDFLANIPHTEEIYFAGGEPLLIPENLQILQEVLEINPKIRIIYNTNLSTLSFQGVHYLDLWKKLENLLDYVSLDDLAA